jgi:hypothetical protein
MKAPTTRDLRNWLIYLLVYHSHSNFIHIHFSTSSLCCIAKGSTAYWFLQLNLPWGPLAFRSLFLFTLKASGVVQFFSHLMKDPENVLILCAIFVGPITHLNWAQPWKIAQPKLKKKVGLVYFVLLLTGISNNNWNKISIKIKIHLLNLICSISNETGTCQLEGLKTIVDYLAQAWYSAEIGFLSSTAYLGWI